MKRETYQELKKRQQAEVNDFPLGCAFSNEQFKKAMEMLGLTENDTDKIYSIPGVPGCFYRRTDAPRFHEMFNRHDREKREAIAADINGDGFIYEMFKYELQNHEYGYTRDCTDTLEALDITPEDIAASPALKAGYLKARQEIIDWEDSQP